MKRKLLFLLLLCGGFAAFVGIKTLMMRGKDNAGRLRIISSPAAGVFIDSTAVGKTPFEEKLKEGEYTIKLIPEGMESDVVSWQGKVRISRGAITFVNRELGSSEVSSAGEIMTITKIDGKLRSSNHGGVYVETDPPGAIVHLDNDEKGVAPIALHDVLKGDHEVSVFLPGFFRRTKKINVDGGFRTNITFSLAIDSTKRDVVKLVKEKQEQREREARAATESAQVAGAESSEQMITIQNTPTGFLRVRSEPGINSLEVARVKPNERFVLVEEVDGWYKIRLSGGGEGWVSSDYAVKDATPQQQAAPDTLSPTALPR